jgi:hypothetical protein
MVNLAVQFELQQSALRWLRFSPVFGRNVLFWCPVFCPRLAGRLQADALMYAC